MRIAAPIPANVPAPARTGRIVERPSGSLETAIGPWRLTRLLAAGPWAWVYRARPATAAATGCGDFVVKTSAPECLPNPLARALLRREGQVARMIQHPHLVAVLSDHTIDETPYLVLPYLEGAALDRVLGTCVLEADDRELLFPVATACLVARQAAEALAALHERDWLHGDVKPANVLVASGGHATLLDLGLARRAGSEECRSESLVAMTYGYAAPELFSPHGQLTAAGDVYALGVLLFELLAGRPLFAAASHAELVRMHRQEALPSIRLLRPTVSRELAELLRRMLAKEPLRRPCAADVVRWLSELEIAEFAA